MVFERAAQVNARFVAGASSQAEIVEALHGLGIEDRQISVLDRTLTPAVQAPVAAPGLVTQLRNLFGGKAARSAAVLPAQEMQVMVYMGQDDRLSASVQELFRHFGAAGVEYFAPTRTAQRVFTQPTDVSTEAAAPATEYAAPKD